VTAGDRAGRLRARRASHEEPVEGRAKAHAIAVNRSGFELLLHRDEVAIRWQLVNR
jgi:hypothetical protein